ncbi:NADH-quinone oxidoreductase subunit K [Candidatus Nesciobacter abundans]|uniref:Uncharacterized protein n=1 Tax=Candidatus Nesciobacter abundans TaxID=2601668 RepID=A0A5C0UH39_9PROT|nr:NADH-quinone oxidoreductase subunit K [Candidatus Nesciobacter abundans]QEK39017.1 hypothetical protein FZC36_01025 [Candidatus Nesciobacter abundans]
MIILSAFLIVLTGIFMLFMGKIRSVIGVGLIGQGVNLLIISVNKPGNVLVQSIVLTSIVISLGFMAVLLRSD